MTGEHCVTCGQLREVAADAAPSVTAPCEAHRAVALLLNGQSQEDFAVVMLSTRNELIGEPVLVARGGLNVCAIQPRDVLRPALMANAAAIIVAHNHPSGGLDPSPEDLVVTRALREAARIVGIDFLDHLIVGGDRWSSLRERGLL